MIRIKGTHIKFEMVSGKLIALPSSFGIMHDPEGRDIPRCAVHFGPYTRTGSKVEPTSADRAYFGDDYRPDQVVVDLPEGAWNPIGEVVQIFYRRRGKFEGNYRHSFKRVAKPTLLKHASKKFYKFEMTSFCIIDDRGFVFP